MNQEEIFEQLKNSLGALRVSVNEPLSNHTYFKIGGPARYFFEAKTVEDLKLALVTAYSYKIPVFILGGGANILVSDKGFYGLVIKNRASGVKLVGIKGTIGKTGKGIKTALIWAASGTLMNQLARFTIDQGLEGLEFLLSVPGTVGGGLKINAHFQVENNEFIGNRLVTATVFDPKTAEIKTHDHKYFEFGYDRSKIQKTSEIVLEAVFRLDTAEDKSKLWQKAVDGVKVRNSEQPMGVACSGCIFRNIEKEDAIRLSTPNLTTSAGYIIESLGLKGAKIGGAEVSQKHANYIINTNQASASDVVNLINLIKSKVKETYNIDLKEEIFYVGRY